MAKYKIIPSSRTIVQSPISIGHKAEKGVEAIEFDVTAWVETYGSGTLTVIMRRWGDAIPYPIALEIDENNKATWVLSDTDTARAGMAYAQLSYVVGDEVVKKSDIYTFRVMDSLTGEGELPEAYESWLEHLQHLAAEAMAEALDIEDIPTDKTLTIDGGIADAKSTGDALTSKADKSTTYTKTEVDALIDEVEVETDTTLEVAGAPADAAETGRQIDLLKADLGDVTETVVSNNLIDQSAIANGTTVVYANGVLTGVSSALKSLYPEASPFPISLEDQTTRYTLSFEAYTDAEQGTNGNGIYVAFLYSDGSKYGKYVQNTVTSYTLYEVVSSTDLTKSIVGVFFNYGANAQNTWHIKNMMLNKGTSAQPYEPYSTYSAKDVYARNAISEVQTSVSAQIEGVYASTSAQGVMVDDIRSAGLSNFFDQSVIAEGEGITFDGVELKGTANAFITAFPASSYIPVTLPDYSIRYTLSFEAYTDGNDGTDSNGLKLYYLYDDGPADPISLPNNTSEFTLFTFLTTSIMTKHLVGIYFGLGAKGENVWHIKNMMLNKTTTAQAYVPYYTAHDKIARSGLDDLDIRKVENSFFNKAYIHNGRIKFASHRGLRSSEMLYENSVASFEAAGIAKAWGCETDIRYTSDGVMVCLHDASIDRTTNGTGNVIDMTYAQLQQYYLKDGDGVVSDTLKVPTFKEYLRICKTYSMTAIIEIKNVVLSDFFEMIEQEKMTESCIVICPRFRLRDARAITKTIPIMCLCDSTQTDYTTIIDTMLGYGVDNVGISYERGAKLTEQVIDSCHENGLFVNVWTVESATEAKTLFLSGADFITSNSLTDW